MGVLCCNSYLEADKTFYRVHEHVNIPDVFELNVYSLLDISLRILQVIRIRG